jgi:hypothetical protein
VKLDCLFLFLSIERLLLKIGPEVVGPAETTTLATTVEPDVLLHLIPVPSVVYLGLFFDTLILFERPGSLLQLGRPAGVFVVADTIGFLVFIVNVVIVGRDVLIVQGRFLSIRRRVLVHPQHRHFDFEL